ncbi:MAG TPA: hypothetical protein VFX96_00765, partial [Pyrinomonadaceae bacterium]|nr:hypothetical protein [Pyrinomonadaceae bacterium]
MDANGTRYHLLLGRDWLRCRVVGAGQPRALLPEASEQKTLTAKSVAPESGLVWNSERNELTLHALLFQFTASPKDKPPALESRRG